MPITMLRLLSMLLVLLPAHTFAASCPPAPQAPTPETMQAAMRAATDHGYLWRISKDGHTSFLYGTMHVGKPEWSFPGVKLSAALRDADTVALEMDLMDPDVQARLQQEMAALHGNSLPEALAKRIGKMADELCVPYAAISRAPPELQVAMLEMMVGRWEGLDGAYATDIVLAGMGHGLKKNVVSLETPESQIKALLMPTRQETAEYVESSLKELEDGSARRQIRRLSQAWANSDYAEMEHFEEWCECMNTEIDRKVSRRVLDDRNARMADAIDALHKSGNKVFAAVGSLHLFGVTGLPALLEKRGYQVEQVELNSRRKTADRQGAAGDGRR